MIRVIGVGSPFGDDAAGLHAARLLAAAALVDVEVVTTDRPGIDLIELLVGAERVIVIDAVRSAHRPGLLHDLDLRRLRAARGTTWSSHGFGVGDALRLAAALGGPRLRGRFLGIEIGPEHPRPGTEPSAAIVAAAQGAADAACRWVARYRARS